MIGSVAFILIATHEDGTNAGRLVFEKAEHTPSLPTPEDLEVVDIGELSFYRSQEYIVEAE